MNPRVFCIPGIFFLFSAFVLLLIVSISLPALDALDFARTHFSSGLSSSQSSNSIDQVRFGIWAPCIESAQSHVIDCPHTGHAYQFQLQSPTNNQVVTIGSSWTRGLAIHPVAAAVAFLALLFSFSTHVTVTLIASLLSFLAALLTLIAFACDIALFARVKHEFSKLQGVSAHTNTGPGFWLTFVAFLLLLLAGCTVCFGRRRARMDGAANYPATTRPGFFGRFRRKPAAY